MFFFFNDTATTEIYTLSLHDALPISRGRGAGGAARLGLADAALRTPLDAAPAAAAGPQGHRVGVRRRAAQDRKSTRLNSSHGYISYAVFCLKKKNISQTLLPRINGSP